jgi:ADP-ribose pyrophosphatase YjhB (NUDIX family)
MVWKPAVTVAAIIEREGRFLFVEERAAEGERVLNQPAGHWEAGETLVQACAREALEETGCSFVPRSLVGVYAWRSEQARETYLRFAFCGDVAAVDSGRAVDAAILRSVWLSAAELRSLSVAGPGAPRSPLVLRCVEDYLAGRRYPLELVAHLG